MTRPWMSRDTVEQAERNGEGICRRRRVETIFFAFRFFLPSPLSPSITPFSHMQREGTRGKGRKHVLQMNYERRSEGVMREQCFCRGKQKWEVASDGKRRILPPVFMQDYTTVLFPSDPTSNFCVPQEKHCEREREKRACIMLSRNMSHETNIRQKEGWRALSSSSNPLPQRRILAACVSRGAPITLLLPKSLGHKFVI